MTRPLALLANPSAADGKSLKALDTVRAEFTRANAPFRLVTPAGPDAARAEAVKASEAGETVVAIGGDGTVGLLAGALRDRPTPLAIIPAGRGNDFARVLHIPDDIAEATRVAIEGEEKLLDVGDVDGRSFVCIASLGFDSDANRIANETKLVKGNLVYLYAALRAVVGWKHASFRVTVDGKTTEARGWSVAVANSKAYGGGMYIAPQAKLDDGELDVLIGTEYSKLQFLGMLAKVFKGTHTDDPRVLSMRGKEVEVSADRPFVVYADGDPIGQLPVKVTVKPRSLRVLVPRGS